MAPWPCGECCTTNAIESLHMQLRKIIKNRGHFPNDESARLEGSQLPLPNPQSNPKVVDIRDLSRGGGQFR